MNYMEKYQKWMSKENLDPALKAELVSILHTINDGLADAVNCDELRVLHGRDYIQEEILGLKFKISPF